MKIPLIVVLIGLIVAFLGSFLYSRSKSGTLQPKSPKKTKIDDDSMWDDSKWNEVETPRYSYPNTYQKNGWEAPFQTNLPFILKCTTPVVEKQNAMKQISSKYIENNGKWLVYGYPLFYESHEDIFHILAFKYDPSAYWTSCALAEPHLIFAIKSKLKQTEDESHEIVDCIDQLLKLVENGKEATSKENKCELPDNITISVLKVPELVKRSDPSKSNPFITILIKKE